MSKIYKSQSIDASAKQQGSAIVNPEELPELLRGKSEEELIERQSKGQEVELLKSKLQECKPGKAKEKVTGKKYWEIYEDICKEILAKIFSQEFTTLHIDEQARTSEWTGFNCIIRDIIVQNNPSSNSSIWAHLKKEYECKEIVFECKNLKGPIAPDHIFQLFLYLTGGTGRFGIILSRNGKIKKSALRAIERLYQISKGHLVRDHYLILVFSDEDIKSMLDNYVYGQPQEQLLGDKLQEHRTRINL